MCDFPILRWKMKQAKKNQHTGCLEKNLPPPNPVPAGMVKHSAEYP
jgi:hypothetical protein